MAEERIGLRVELINKACSIAMKAHSSPEKPYLYVNSRSSSEAIFGFTGAWHVRDWFAPNNKPFGETKINLQLFPSMKTISDHYPALVNEAFLRRFEAVLTNSTLKAEVEKAGAEKKQIVFTGHSSGAPTAIFATLWFLESYQKQVQQFKPRCLTFGSPLTGDQILSHALRRENWSSYFVHFIMRYDIVPRIFLTALTSMDQVLQPILYYFNPNSTLFKNDSISNSSEASNLFFTIMRTTATLATHAACKFMGCTNLLLETVTKHIELSPYRPFGTYVFCTGDGKLVILENPDAILQLLFYSLQLPPETKVADASQRSLKEHLIYQSELEECLGMQTVASLDPLEDLPLTGHGGEENAAISMALNDLGLSARARLCLRATGELEKQKSRNQSKVDNNKSKIVEGINMLAKYRAMCEEHRIGYYDAFKLQKDREDFNSNVKRLELAGIWDEIGEMVKRFELPDGFEGRKEWIELGTRYRRIVEPLDIANYYRHLKNEDTGPYMTKGRPRRYKFTQKWHEHAEKVQAESIPDSCILAEVEELSMITESSANVRERVLELERNVSKWIRSGQLHKDVLLPESAFVTWWNKLPPQHRSESCMADLLSK